MHLGLVSGHSTRNTIFIVRQLQEKFYVVNKTLHTWPLSIWKRHSIVYTDVFTKALGWAPYCSSRFWKLSPKFFVQDVPGKTCVQIIRSTSHKNHWINCQRSWSSGRSTWKERDFGSTWAKPRFWYLDRGSMFFRILTKTPVACVSRAPAQSSFSVLVVQHGSTRNPVVSLASWSLISA